MKFQLVLFSFLSSILFVHCGRFHMVKEEPSKSEFKNPGPMPKVPGKCFDLCEIREYENDSILKPVYDKELPTGDEHYEEVEIMTPTMSKWVQTKSEDCTSNNEEDCLIWCLKEVPGEYQTVRRLKEGSDDRRIIGDTLITVKRVVDNYYEWKEVVCKSDLTPDLIEELQFVLNEKEYYDEDFSEIFDEKTRAALKEFQRKNDLPIGNLDMDSLKALGIEL